MVLDRNAHPGISHRSFRDIVDSLRAGDVLVRNRSRVVAARLLGHRRSGARIEVLALEEVEAGRLFRGMARPASRLRLGETVTLEGGHEVTVVAKEGGGILRFAGHLGSCLADGHVPLPPYIQRRDDAGDEERYQTVYANVDGSVAAPTAGLHFTTATLQQLVAKGVEVLDLTLHVGLGTFRPVSADTLDEHEMHPERVEIPEPTAHALCQAAAEERRVIAIGTTSARALEGMFEYHGAVRSGPFTTRVFIQPGYRFKVVDGLLTNFHQPRSTLLALVYAFAGTDRARRAYSAAIAERYRFLSYGDAMLIV